MASMVGSESMTSSDWMLLALCSMGQNSQRKVGEAFVQRLLEKGDVHPAVALLLGLGELNEAVEAYVARKYYLEATLLTCLLFPVDWQRQSYLVRKWGEIAVTTGQPELAVRCFYVTSLESSEPWTSPRAQDAVFQAQNAHAAESQLSPPLSPPSAGPNRVKQSGLKLFTTFNDTASQGGLSAGGDRTAQGVTPIAQSALSPGGGNQQWLQPGGRSSREPSSARTATPGGYGRKRFPSKPDYSRGTPIAETPIETPYPTTAVKEPESIEINVGVVEDSHHSQHPSIEVTKEEPKEEGPMLLSAVAYDPSGSKKKASDALPSPAHGVFEHLKQESRQRNGSRDRKPDGLYLDVVDTVESSDAPSTASQSGFLAGRGAELSPPLTSNSVKSAKVRSIDQYISSLEEANYHSRKASRSRAGSKDRVGRTSRQGARESSQTRGRSGTRYIKPAKRSPSSPVPMSPEEAAMYSSGNNDSFDDERYYKVASPAVASVRGRSRSAARGTSKKRSNSNLGRRVKSTERRSRSRNAHVASRQASREGRPSEEDKGRTSPSSPVPMSSAPHFYKSDGDDEDTREVTSPVRIRQRSSSRRPSGRSRQASPDRHGRERSHSRRPSQQDVLTMRPESPEMTSSRQASRQRMPKLQTDFSSGPSAAQRFLSQKERAARELEERRLSLARRPSAPVIPHPQDLSRPPISGRSLTDLGNSPTSYMPPMSSHSDKGLPRSHTVDPEMMRYHPRYTVGTSTKSTPIGLPATPRALRHPRYMSSDPERDEVPAVPQIPEHIIEVNINSHEGKDDVAPLLPATTFGQPGMQSPQRSASAPPEHINGDSRRGSGSSRGSGNKRISPPPITASIDETLHGESQQIIVVGEPAPKENPPLLAELQHLAIPPPPPPPPFHGHSRNGSGVINIAIDEHPTGRPATTTPAMLPPIDIPVNDTSPPARPQTGSPHMHRRGRGSVSESIGSRLRGVTERMRSTSRSRAKSPPNDYGNHAPSPYETVIPGMPLDFGHNRSNSSYGQRTKSPLSESQHFGDQIPPPPPPVPLMGSPSLMEQVIPPEFHALSRQNDRGYMRHPREVRANMPPEQIQAGVQPSPTGMI